MKKWMTFFLVFVLCLTVVEVHAKEHLSEKDVRMFLKERGIIHTEDAQITYIQVDGEYALRAVEMLEKNRYESTVTMAYIITEDGQLVRTDIRPMSDISVGNDDYYDRTGVLVTARMSYSMYSRNYDLYRIAYISPYALSVTISGPNDLSIPYMEARLAATAYAYPFPECLNWGTNTDTSQYIIDGMGYYELEFTRTNLTPGLAYGATKFMPDDVILGFSRYGDHDLLVAHIDVETNKGNLIDTEIDFGYPLNSPGT